MYRQKVLKKEKNFKKHITPHQQQIVRNIDFHRNNCYNDDYVEDEEGGIIGPRLVTSVTSCFFLGLCLFCSVEAFGRSAKRPRLNKQDAAVSAGAEGAAG